MSLTGAWMRFTAYVLTSVFALSFLIVLMPTKAHAAPALVQKPTAVNNGNASVSVTIAAATANNLLVAICGTSTAVNITAPGGFSTAKNENSTASQGIFYKVAAGGETSVSCGGGVSSTRWGIQVYEYSGIQKVSPLDAVNTASSTGSGTSAASGTVATNYANDLLIAGLTTIVNSSYSAWTNSFTGENTFANGSGTRATYGGGDRTVASANSYSTSATIGSGSWIGQIAAFKATPAVAFAADIVDGSGNSVASPSVSMATKTRGFTCQTSTGSLGVSTQKIRVTNTNPANANGWTLAMAATSGTGSTWTAGANHYDYNDAGGSGCTDSDSDTYGGQLSIDPSGAAITPQGGCSTTGVSKLSSTTSYSSGTSSITIASANNTSSYYCFWDFTGYSLSQKIPALQTSGSYSIGFTLTLTAL